MDEGSNTGSDRPERARILLDRIAELLRVDPAFFLSPPARRDAAETDPAELLRIFQSIGDADLRRSVLAMIKGLETKDGGGEGGVS